MQRSIYERYAQAQDWDLRNRWSDPGFMVLSVARAKLHVRYLHLLPVPCINQSSQYLCHRNFNSVLFRSPLNVAAHLYVWRKGDGQSTIAISLIRLCTSF